MDSFVLQASSGVFFTGNVLEEESILPQNFKMKLFETIRRVSLSRRAEGLGRELVL